MNKDEFYNYTLRELQNELGDYGDFTESTLCEILGHDNFYFPVYNFTDFELSDGTYDEILGFFIIYLKDGIILMPFCESRQGDGFEQLLPDRARYVKDDDYELLINSRNWLKRSMNAIDSTIEQMKLKLLVNRGITKEKIINDFEK